MLKGYLKVLVLKKLEGSDKSGYDLISDLDDVIGERPSPGSIYPLLSELNNKKLISVREEGRKKLYSLTKKGKDSIDKIIDEKQKIIMNHIEFIKLVGGITGQDDIDPTINFCKDVNQNTDKFFRNVDLWLELKDVITKISLSKGYEQKQDKVRKILKRTIDDLKRLDARD